MSRDAREMQHSLQLLLVESTVDLVFCKKKKMLLIALKCLQSISQFERSNHFISKIRTVILLSHI